MKIYFTLNVPEYLAYSTGLLLLFSVFYHVVFRRLTFFTINRYYLLSTLILSLTLPLCKLEVPARMVPSILQTTGLKGITEDTDKLIQLEESPHLATRSKVVPTPKSSLIIAVQIIYYCTTLVLLLRLFFGLLRLMSQRRNGVKKGDFIWVKPLRNYNNSSFFNLLFINAGFLTKQQLEQVIAHEEVHRKKLHSLDKVLVELVHSFLWFNPLVYYYRFAIAQNHEFEVDQTLCKSCNKYGYSNFLVELCTPSSLCVVNSFSRRPLQNRIQFIFKKPSSNAQKIAYTLILPVTIIAFLLVSVEKSDALVYKNVSVLPAKITRFLLPVALQAEKRRENILEKTEAMQVSLPAPSENLGLSLPDLDLKENTASTQPFTIVLDPGHGGEDKAALVHNVYEKDLVLDIARELKNTFESAGYNVITTRNADEFVPLAERVKYQGDIFISLHANVSIKKDEEALMNGMEIIIPNKWGLRDAVRLDKSVLLAETIKSGLDDMEIAMNQNFKDPSLFVLTKNSSPSILLELGYMNNKKDFDLLMDKSYQQKLARRMLQAIKNYQSKILKSRLTELKS